MISVTDMYANYAWSLTETQNGSMVEHRKQCAKEIVDSGNVHYAAFIGAKLASDHGEKAAEEFFDLLIVADEQKRRYAYVEFENGDSIRTPINGSVETIKRYYQPGREFNLGNMGEDSMQKVVHCWVFDNPAVFDRFN